LWYWLEKSGRESVTLKSVIIRHFKSFTAFSPNSAIVEASYKIEFSLRDWLRLRFSTELFETHTSVIGSSLSPRRKITAWGSDFTYLAISCLRKYILVVVKSQNKNKQNKQTNTNKKTNKNKQTKQTNKNKQTNKTNTQKQTNKQTQKQTNKNKQTKTSKQTKTNKQKQTNKDKTNKQNKQTQTTQKRNNKHLNKESYYLTNYHFPTDKLTTLTRTINHKHHKIWWQHLTFKLPPLRMIPHSWFSWFIEIRGTPLLDFNLVWTGVYLCVFEIARHSPCIKCLV